MHGVAKLARGAGNVGLLEVPEPTVIANHVIVEMKAAGVCGTDLHIYHDEYPSLPLVIMGHEVAGVVAEIGQGVTSVMRHNSLPKDALPMRAKAASANWNGTWGRRRWNWKSQKSIRYLNLAPGQKREIVKMLTPEYPVKTVCEVIAMSRSSYYHKPNVLADEALRTALLTQAETWPSVDDTKPTQLACYRESAQPRVCRHTTQPEVDGRCRHV